MTRRKTALIGTTLTATLAIGLYGCGSGILPTDTIAQAVAKIDIFNQLTVADVVQGFQDFVGRMMQFRQAGQTFRNLSDEQRQKLEALQEQLDSGEITREAFESGVREVIGDQAADVAFAGRGFFGSPTGHEFGSFRNPLELTAEQMDQARAIFESAHDDIQALRDKAQTDIRGVLTEEQLAKLDELRTNRRGPGGFGGGRGFFGFGRGSSEANRNDAAAHLGRGRSGGDAVARLVEELGLTQEQQDQIKAIREQLRADVAARHVQARGEFESILTEDQKTELNEIEQRFCRFPGADRFLQCDEPVANDGQ